MRCEHTSVHQGASGKSWMEWKIAQVWRVNEGIVYASALLWRKHFDSRCPRREQNSHLWRLDTLFCELWGWEEDEEYFGCLDEIDEAEDAEVVPERCRRVCSIFLSDWKTDCLSN